MTPSKLAQAIRTALDQNPGTTMLVSPATGAAIADPFGRRIYDFAPRTLLTAPDDSPTALIDAWVRFVAIPAMNPTQPRHRDGGSTGYGLLVEPTWAITVASGTGVMALQLVRAVPAPTEGYAYRPVTNEELLTHIDGVAAAAGMA